MQKIYKIKLGEQEFEILQDEDGKFIKPNFLQNIESFGTALKPALEPIVVARKPLSEKTVAENVLKWGTGGINIDACRVGTKGGVRKINIAPNSESKTTGFGCNGDLEDVGGRFPANFIWSCNEDEYVIKSNVSAEDILKIKTYYENKKSIEKNMYKITEKQFREMPAELQELYEKLPNQSSDEVLSLFQNTKAARFFYCAKASKKERNKGCEELEEQKVGDGRKKEVDNAFQRGKTLRHNTHPTVKPIALMEYLVKLVSRENAIVLDPFAGSGSTLIACKKVGRQYIGIEREPEYVKIARARLNSY